MALSCSILHAYPHKLFLTFFLSMVVSNWVVYVLVKCPLWIEEMAFSSQVHFFYLCCSWNADKHVGLFKFCLLGKELPILHWPSNYFHQKREFWKDWNSKLLGFVFFCLLVNGAGRQYLPKGFQIEFQEILFRESYYLSFG